MTGHLLLSCPVVLLFLDHVTRNYPISVYLYNRIKPPDRSGFWVYITHVCMADPELASDICEAARAFSCGATCWAEVSKRQLKALYKSRWQVEVDLRNIKTTLGMEKLSCKTPEMNEKEIWVYLLAVNLIRLLMAQAAVLCKVLPRRLSFKHTVQLWLAWSQQNYARDGGGGQQHLFILIAQVRVGNRPGRIEPRAHKRRPKPYSLLMKPRDEAREEIRKNGHPKSWRLK